MNSKHQPLTVARSIKVTPEQIADKRQAKITAIPRAVKLETFIQLAQSGKTVARALLDSGILERIPSSYYDPTTPNAELDIEELFYRRCAASKTCQVISDAEYQQLDNQQLLAHQERADLCSSELSRLVDWLYFVRGLPMQAIATALQVQPQLVYQIKAALSQEFATTIRLQSAESYISDLLRVKESLKADLMYRRSRLATDNPQQLTLTKLLWELENRYIDRLQEIGIIDKNIGRMDIHEEWHVTIGPAGQPVNHKLSALPTTKEFDNQLATDLDAEIITTPQSAESPVLTLNGLTEQPNPEQLLGVVAHHGAALSPVITVTKGDNPDD